jgi:hypothetical protein
MHFLAVAEYREYRELLNIQLDISEEGFFYRLMVKNFSKNCCILDFLLV